jgi:hypothetical protein
VRLVGEARTLGDFGEISAGGLEQAPCAPKTKPQQHALPALCREKRTATLTARDYESARVSRRVSVGLPRMAA